MDDDAVEAPCTRKSCSNLRNNLETLLMQTKQQAHKLENYPKIKAENEVLRMRLMSTEATLHGSTNIMHEAVNAEEIAGAESQQTQPNMEYYQKKVAMLQEQADEAENHKKEAIHWREKYDFMGALAEKLGFDNFDLKSKYEATVKALEVVRKKMLSLQNKTQKTRKFDKNLKSAIQVIDSLSTTSNLSKQSGTTNDLANNVFHRDDVRLFNSQPWKDSMSPGASTSQAGASTSQAGAQDDSIADVADDHVPSNGSNDDDIILITDDEVEYVNEDDDENNDPEIQKLENMLVKRVAGNPQNPDFVPKMLELKAKKNAPRLIESRAVRTWPAGLRKPTTTDSGSLLNPKSVHSKQIPTCDFEAIAQATEKRKKELLGKPSEVSTATSTIHVKKEEIVSEQQSERMKGESTEEKIARMRAEAEAMKTSSAPERRIVAVAPVVSAPKEPERVEPMVSEMGSDKSDAHDPNEQATSGSSTKIPETQKESRRPSRRPRSTSTPAPKRVKTCPSEVMQPPIPLRRSSRIAVKPVEMTPLKLETSKNPKGRPRAMSGSVDLTVEVAPQQSETPKKSKGRMPSQPEVRMTTRLRPRATSSNFV